MEGQEDQDLKLIFGYTVNLKPASAAEEPVLNSQTKQSMYHVKTITTKKPSCIFPLKDLGGIFLISFTSLFRLMVLGINPRFHIRSFNEVYP